MEFLRFLCHWMQLEQRCSTTLLSPTTSQRRTRSQSRAWTKPSPAPQLKKMQVAAGSAPPPVSSPNHSTGETATEERIKELILLCVTRVDTIGNRHNLECLCETMFYFFCSWLETNTLIFLFGTPHAGLFPVVSHVNIFWFFSKMF